MAEREQEVFLPEEVDEQIDEYLAYTTMHRQAPDSATAQAVQALQQHYAPAEEDAALQRVWQRFEQKQATMRKRKTAMHITIPQKERNRAGALNVSYKKGHSLLTHRLNLAVAVFFVLLLVGSMAALFRLAPNRYSIVGSPPKEKMMFAVVNGTLYRLDMKTHKPLWHIAGPLGLGEVVGNTYYVTTWHSNQTTLVALDVANGKIRWQRGTSGGPLSAPVILSKNVYVSTIKNDFLTLVALDSTTGIKKWEKKMANIKTDGQPIHFPNVPLQVSTWPSVQLIAASDNALYAEVVTFKNGKVVLKRIALNSQNGNQLWQKNVEIAHNGVGKGFVVDGVLNVAETDSDIHRQEHGYFAGYDAASGKQLWGRQLDGPLSMFGTTLLNGVIYINTNRLGQDQGNSIYAFSAKDGSQLWHYQDTSRSGSSFPTVTENGIYINRYSPQALVAIDSMSGKVRWTYNFQDTLTVEYPPEADNDHVYLSLPNNVIQILRASDGKQLGSFKVGGKVDPNNRVILQVV